MGLLKICSCCTDLTAAAVSHVLHATVMSCMHACMQKACRAQSRRDKHVHHELRWPQTCCSCKLSVRYWNSIITQNRTHDNITQSYRKCILGCCYPEWTWSPRRQREILICNTLMITLQGQGVSCSCLAVCELSDVCVDRQEFKSGGRHTRTCSLNAPLHHTHTPSSPMSEFSVNPAVVAMIKETTIVFRNITLPTDTFIFHGRLSTLRIICTIIICIMQMFPLGKCVSLLWCHTSAGFFKWNSAIFQLFDCRVLEVTDKLLSLWTGLSLLFWTMT